MMRYFLDFKNDGYGIKKIDEPIGIEGMVLTLKQRDNGLGRDVFSAGKGEMQFEFTIERNHEFQMLLYYNRRFGFESNVVLTIEQDAVNKIFYDLDFANADTDDLEYFKCKGIEDTKLQIVSARKDVKVDINNGFDVDGNFIGELPSTNMLLLSKPLIQESSWEKLEILDVTLKAEGKNTASSFYHINPCFNIVKSEIENTNAGFSAVEPVYKNLPFSLFEPSETDYLYLTAKDNLRNLKINLSNIDLDFSTDVDNGGDGYVNFKLEIRYGIDFKSATRINKIDIQKTEKQTYSFQGDFEETIPILNRGESVWILYTAGVRQSSNVNAGSFPRKKFEVFLKIRNMKMSATAESTSYNSIHKCYRLVDVVKRVVRSISGLQTNMPIYEFGGDFYDNVLLDGNMLRGIDNSPFNVSLKDIEQTIKETNCSWEIGSDGKVFFGKEVEFYPNNEVEFFNVPQFETLKKTYNQKYKINEFMFKYKRFQSQKENEEIGTKDEIHGESTLTLFNKNVENKKIVEVEFIRSAFLAEKKKKKGLEILDVTSTQNDDDVFIFDVEENTSNLTFSETTEIQHFYDDVNFRLILKNSGSINFERIGIKVNTYFFITNQDPNAGTYTVFSVSPQELVLVRVLGVVFGSGNGIRLTNYVYTILKEDVPLKAYTDKGFTETQNLNASNRYSNRRYSVTKNILDYYQSYLATANLYWSDKPLKNTWYKNNLDYSAKFNGQTIRQAQDILPKNPIVSPVMYEDMVFANVSFARYVYLVNKMRSERGYIRTFDNNGRVIKVYPKEMEFEMLKNELRINGEEKYEPVSMSIVKETLQVLVNNESRVYELLYEFDKVGRLIVFDENRFRLYNPVYWFEVSVNGVLPKSQQELDEWLKLINN